MKAMLNDNVVMLQRLNRDLRNVGEDITSFLKRHNIGKGEKLISTAAEYSRHIEKFFRIMLGKELNQLTIESLDLLPMHIEQYQTFLVNAGYRSNTVNSHIASLSALYGFFEENKYRYRNNDNEWCYISQSIFNGVDKVDVNDANSYGYFSHQEVVDMIEIAKTLDNGERKSLAIELASKTSFRLESVVHLNIKEDFRKQDGVWVIKTVDKGKINEKSIMDDLYNKLLKISDGSGKIFNFTERTLQRTIDTLVSKMGLEEERNLCFHSLKKYGIAEVSYMTNGNIEKMAQQGNHASFETTLKYYTELEKDFSKMPCLMIGQPLDLDPLQQMTSEELIKIIHSASRSTQYEIMNLLTKNK